MGVPHYLKPEYLKLGWLLVEICDYGFSEQLCNILDTFNFTKEIHWQREQKALLILGSHPEFKTNQIVLGSSQYPRYRVAWNNNDPSLGKQWVIQEWLFEED